MKLYLPLLFLALILLLPISKIKIYYTPPFEEGVNNIEIGTDYVSPNEQLLNRLFPEKNTSSSIKDNAIELDFSDVYADGYGPNKKNIAPSKLQEDSYSFTSRILDIFRHNLLTLTLLAISSGIIAIFITSYLNKKKKKERITSKDNINTTSFLEVNKKRKSISKVISSIKKALLCRTYAEIIQTLQLCIYIVIAFLLYRLVCETSDISTAIFWLD